MFKSLLILLLPLIAVNCAPHIDNSASFPNEQKITNIKKANEEDEDPNVLHGYTYVDKEDYSTTRTFDSRLLAPTINEAFCAPSGYVYTLSISDEQIEEIFAQMDFVNAKYEYMNFAFYYGIYGTEVYSDSNSKFYNEGGDNLAARAWMKNALKDEVKDRLLLKIDDVITEAELYLRFNISFATVPDSEDNYHWWDFVFYSQVKRIVPHNESAYIVPRIQYFQSGEEKRITIYPRLMPGFFCQYAFEDDQINYNSYGWKTDTTKDYFIDNPETGLPHYLCVYNITVLAFDTVPIGYIDQMGGLEITYPESPIKARLKLDFVANGTNHVYYSDEFIIGDPNLRMSVDNEENQEVIHRYSSHSYNVSVDNLSLDNVASFDISVNAIIDRLYDDQKYVKYCYSGELPGRGEEGIYYYLPSSREIELHNQNKDEEFLKDKAEGTYYNWSDDSEFFYEINEYPLFKDFKATDEISTKEAVDKEEIINSLNPTLSLPIIGRFSSYHFRFYLTNNNGDFVYIEKDQETSLEVVEVEDNDTYIILNAPDEINLINNNESFEIIPTISSYDENIKYYFDHAITNEGIIDIKEEDNGRLIITPLNAGATDLTIYVESRLFNTISKTVHIRVIEASIDGSKIQVNEENAYAGSDLTASLNIRGYTQIQNVDVSWDVLNKRGNPISKDKYIDNQDASVTILAADIGTYTFVATYEEMELDRVSVEVRYRSSDVVDSEDEIILNVPDNVNLLTGGESLSIIPSVSSYDPNIDYYYDYEISRENIVLINELDSELILSPINAGLLTLTIYVSYEPYHVLSKTINIRVLDAIYDVSNIEISDEFHYAGNDLKAAISIRGFTNFQNLKIDWSVKNKKGQDLAPEQLIIGNDATLIIKNPDSDDYTISATYEGILLDTVVVKVRYVDMNKFLRANIWWIFLITLGFVALLIFLRFILRRSKTTVENIERVYQVFCQCLSDDTLSLDELNKIRKEINKCMHRCEDLNIDALNQYEKATRYLRKSLNDVKLLIKNYDITSKEERSVYIDRLDKDLAKALNVAKEIEHAKGLIENYHMNANRHNYESLDSDNKKKKK